MHYLSTLLLTSSLTTALAQPSHQERSLFHLQLPAMQDILTDNETGLIVPQKNALALANKVNYLLDNPALLLHLGKQGR
ncbi:MAG: hypothetical protein VSS75_014500, partial [Candidatus Parabeggiatoa sp.]|nr:hypothetical protein [Candidatus Parabeggiatoa sp.]